MWDGAAAMGPRKPVLNILIFFWFHLNERYSVPATNSDFLSPYLCKPVS